MPYFALINGGTEAEEATIGLATPEQMEKFVDDGVISGRYKPLKDDLITVTIEDMRIDPRTLKREVVKAYLWDFEGGKDPYKVDDWDVNEG